MLFANCDYPQPDNNFLQLMSQCPDPSDSSDYSMREDISEMVTDSIGGLQMEPGQHPLQEAMTGVRITVSDTSKTIMDALLLKIANDITSDPGDDGKTLPQKAVIESFASLK